MNLFGIGSFRISIELSFRKETAPSKSLRGGSIAGDSILPIRNTETMSKAATIGDLLLFKAPKVLSN
jgi:hypothetical protein